MNDIGKKIVRLGRNKKVILTTIIIMIALVIVSFTVSVVSGSKMDMALAIIAPVIIISFAIWYVIGLLVKIKHLEEHLRMLATHDALTGAMTRNAFLETYESTYHYSQRNKLPLALVSIEVDDFNKKNALNGHAVNDEILISFSHIIEEQKRKSDIFTRMGWGKFVLVLPDTAIKDAITFANKLQCLARETTVKCGQTDIQYSVSMGVSGLEPSNQVNLEQLIKQADDALSQAQSQHQSTESVVEYTNALA